MTTACGHRVRGPAMRHLGTDPPEGSRRVACAPCRHAVGTPLYSTYRPALGRALLPLLTVDGESGRGRHRRSEETPVDARHSQYRHPLSSRLPPVELPPVEPDPVWPETDPDDPGNVSPRPGVGPHRIRAHHLKTRCTRQACPITSGHSFESAA